MLTGDGLLNIRICKLWLENTPLTTSKVTFDNMGIKKSVPLGTTKIPCLYPKISAKRIYKNPNVLLIKTTKAY